MDIEAAGGAVTGGLIAGAVEKPEGHAGEPHAAICSDCGAPTSGKFCSNCGQPTHVHRTLLHLGEELLHGVMHFDGRIWRTLPLLAFNPGRLTREWIQGRRTRYVSPLAMFLFTVFIMFFLLSFAGGIDVKAPPLDERIAEARLAVAEADQAVEEARAKVEAGEPGAQGVLIGAEAAATGLRSSVERLEAAKTSGPRADGREVGSWQAELVDAVNDSRGSTDVGGESQPMRINGSVNDAPVKIGIGDDKMKAKILEKLANPDFAIYKIQQTLYKFAFLLVPLSMPFIWLLVAWRRGFTWYDHGVFVLYSLTFMAMISMVIGIIARWDNGFTGMIATLLVLWVPVHMFSQLKGTYSLSIFSALWRTVALLFFALLVISVFLVGIILLGLGS